METTRIVYLGTPEISAYLLEGLITSGFNIVGVVTQEDKPQGRKMKLTPSPVSNIAEKYNIPLFKPHKLNKECDFLNDLNPDLLLTFAYGQILSSKVLSFSKLPPINFHASLLPKYRGAAPIQYALANGEAKTGMTIMEMVKQMDAGRIFAQEEIEISRLDNCTSLSEKLSKLALDMAKKYLPLYFENKLEGKEQDESAVTFSPSIKKEEEKLSLDLKPVDFVNKVRSLALNPGAYLLSDSQRFKIYHAEVYSSLKERDAGTLVVKNKKLILQLNDGEVELIKIQQPSKKMMDAASFINGHSEEDIRKMILE